MKDVYPIDKITKKFYSAFSHLRRSLFSKGRDLYAMLTAYFDESGSSHTDKVFVVAGYVSSVNNWEKFEKRWTELLRQYEISKLHRSELENFQGEFKTWNPEKRARFLRSAHAIIKAYTYVGIGSAILKDHFAHGENKILLEKVGGPYTWCIHECLVAIRYWRENRSNRTPIRCVFEKGLSGKSNLEFTLGSLLRECHIDGWSFESKNCIPLQAADVVAYEFYKFNHNQLIEGGKRPIRKSAHDLFRFHERQYFKHWDTERLDAMLKASGSLAINLTL